MPTQIPKITMMTRDDIELADLRRIDARLEQALRDVVALSYPNTMDVTIRKLRQEVAERIQNILAAKKEK